MIPRDAFKLAGRKRQPTGTPSGGQFATEVGARGGIPERSSYPNPHLAVAERESCDELGTDWRNYRLPSGSPAWSEIAEFEYAIREGAHTSFTAEGPIGCRRTLRGTWERCQKRFAKAVEADNVFQASYSAELMRAVNRTAKDLLAPTTH